LGAREDAGQTERTLEANRGLSQNGL
jgi:hypothetical protein